MRCVYCVPPDVKFLPAREILTLEEIACVVHVAARMGIHKVRLTGGEPLARKNIIKLVTDLAAIPEIEDLSLTTNGLLLEEFARPLAGAGLNRVNVSMDTMKPERFKAICRMGELDAVLRGISAAAAAGLRPIKVNVVVMRGTNDDELQAFAQFGMDHGVSVRFIEYMPIRKEPGWQDKYMTREQCLERLAPLLMSSQPVVGNRHDPARYYTLKDGKTLVGLISPVSHGFCHNCNRLRLRPEGTLRGCLLSETGVDIKTILRSGGDDNLVAEAFRRAVHQKGEKGDFSHMRSGMNQLGG
jgi:cyclic pyranopterin phosphate synthase